MLDVLTAASLIPEEDLQSLLKKDLRFNLVFMAASVPEARHLDDLEDLATHLLLTKGEFRALRNSLLRHGYWELSKSGEVITKKAHLDQGELSLHEFTNVSLGILRHLSEDGPCNYENVFFVTTEALKRDFYASVNRALKTLMEKSREQRGDRVLAWSHMGMDFGNFESGALARISKPQRSGK